MSKSVNQSFEHSLPDEQKSSLTTGYPDEKPAIDINLKNCPKEDRPRMISIINRLAKSEAGMEVLQTAVDAGYDFSFSPMNAVGTCEPERKKICLNPVYGDDKLVSSLCHECRHAGQYERSPVLMTGSEWTIKSRVAFTRAMEADAQAYAALACEELFRSGDAEPKLSFYESYPEIAVGAEMSLNKTPEHKPDGSYLEDVFKSWYDQTGVKKKYETSCLVLPLQKDNRRLEDGKRNLQEYDLGIPASIIIANITQTKDGNYFHDDPNVLYSGKYLAVGKSTLRRLESLFDERECETDKDFSRALKGIPVYDDSALSGGGERNKGNEDGTSLFGRMKNRIKGFLGYGELMAEDKIVPRKNADVQGKNAEPSAEEQKLLKIQKIMENKKKTVGRKVTKDLLRQKAVKQGR